MISKNQQPIVPKKEMNPVLIIETKPNYNQILTPTIWDRLQKIRLKKESDFYNSPKWLELARQIRARDDYTCQICGAYGPKDRVSLHVHHIIPKGGGGSDDPSNLTTLCHNCHARQPYHNGRPETIRKSSELLASPVQSRG